MLIRPLLPRRLCRSVSGALWVGGHPRPSCWPGAHDAHRVTPFHTLERAGTRGSVCGQALRGWQARVGGHPRRLIDRGAHDAHEPMMPRR